MDDCQLMNYTVAGNSMNPLLFDGDQITVLRSPEYKVGDIVVATHPIQSDLTIVKRIEAIAPDGRYRLRGANTKESSDCFGLIAEEKIIGKMVTKV